LSESPRPARPLDQLAQRFEIGRVTGDCFRKAVMARRNLLAARPYSPLPSRPSPANAFFGAYRGAFFAPLAGNAFLAA